MKTSIKVKLLSTEHFSESDFLSKDFPKAITKISNYRHLIYFGFLTETYNLYSCRTFGHGLETEEWAERIILKWKFYAIVMYA